MNERIHWLVLRGGRFVMQKMCGFRNIRIRVDGALMNNRHHSAIVRNIPISLMLVGIQDGF